MSKKHKKPAEIRVQAAQRNQVEMQFGALDELIPDEHRVRMIWAYVEGLDLTALYQQIRAVEGRPGRDAVDPKILVALWLFATIEGIGSARKLASCCERDIIYRWICGGVGVNHHLLSDFRTGHEKFLSDLLTDTIATLVHQKIVTLETVAQDGMRVRADAGASSFRREKSLRECRDEAAKHLEKLKAEGESDSNEASNARQKRARERAAKERLAKVDQALEELDELRDQKENRKKGSGEEARCSTTDPEARTMKMADGGFRPAFNVQFATDAKTRMIVGVEVTNNSSDGGQMAPMHADLVERYGVTPKHYLVDGGFTTYDDIDAVERRKTQVIGPIPKASRLLKNGKDPYARQARDTDETFAYRQRMSTEAAKELYKQRPGVAEFPNAECRNRGLQQFHHRGKRKARAETLWQVLAFNFLRMVNLGCLVGVAQAA